MDHFFAEFDQCSISSCFIRKDTRVYYHPQTLPPATLKPLGKCVGMIWMCNPGSAGGLSKQPSWKSILPDPTLGRVLGLYHAAVNNVGKQAMVGDHDYFAVLNCFYSVGPNPGTAHDEWRRSGCRYHETPCADANFIVAAWGLDTPGGPMSDAVNAIRAWGHDSTGQLQPGRLIVYIDPTLPPRVSKISQDLSAMYYPSHPNSQAFRTHLVDLAAALAKFIVADIEQEMVMNLDE